MKKGIIIGAAAAVLIGGGAYFMTKSSSDSKSLTVAIRNYPATFNPQKVEDVGSFEGLTNELATLKSVDKDGNIKNYAAKDIKYDDKTLKVTLIDGLKYEDGTTVKAADYGTAMKVFADPKVKASYSSWATDWIEGAKEFADGKSKEISGFKAIDDKTFEVKTKKHYNFFDKTFISTVWAPVSQKFIDKVGGPDKYGVDYKSFQSSGPLKIEKAINGQLLHLVENKGNALAKDAKVKDLTLKEYKEATSSINEFKSGKLSSVGKTEQADKILGKTKDTKADIENTDPTMFYLITNMKKLDTNTAKALYLSLDKDYINKTFLYGASKVTSSIVPDSYKGVFEKIKDAKKNDFDLEKAKEFAKKAKKKDLTFQTFTGRTYPTFTDAQQDSTIKYMLAQWKKIGFNVTDQKMPLKKSSENIMKKVDADRPFDIAWSGWSPDYPEASTYLNSILGSSTATNYAGWTSKEYDKNVQDAMTSDSESKADDLYAKAAEEAYKAGALQPLFQFSNRAYANKGAYETTSMGYLMKVNNFESVK